MDPVTEAAVQGTGIWGQFAMFGVLVIALGYVAEKVLQYRAKPVDSEARAEYRKKQDAMAERVEKLYEWHNRMDEDGVPVWYVRKSLEKAISDLATAIKAQTIMLQRWMDKHEDG